MFKISIIQCVCHFKVHPTIRRINFKGLSSLKELIAHPRDRLTVLGHRKIGSRHPADQLIEGATALLRAQQPLQCLKMFILVIAIILGMFK